MGSVPWFAAPRLIVPAIYLRRCRSLKRFLYASRVNDRLYINYRLPGDGARIDLEALAEPEADGRLSSASDCGLRETAVVPPESPSGSASAGAET